MRVIIIEDEKIASDLLQKMLLQIDPNIDIVDRCFTLLYGIDSIKKHQPELVFLDVELPIHSGLELIDFFKIEDINFKIIFTTASNQHAIRAFEMSAIDYILKPIQKEKLEKALDRYLSQKLISSANNMSVLTQNLETPNLTKILAPVTNGYEIIDIENIIYLKAEGSYTRIFTSTNQSYLMSKNLKYFDTILSNHKTFVRIHRSYIANIKMAKKIVKDINYLLVFNDELQLPITTEKADSIFKLFI